MRDDQVDTIRYGGDHDSQFIELWEPDVLYFPVGVAALVHGGYWRARNDCSLMYPLVTDLTARGWVVGNLEYRRVGAGGGWPQTVQDVDTGLHALGHHWKAKYREVPWIGIGHSVGGQLLLLAAHHMDAVMALAPVTDLLKTDRERLGEDATVQFMGGRNDEMPQSYEAASPVYNLPACQDVLVIHGDVDVRVPIEHSRVFVEAARIAGRSVSLREVHGLEHLEAIDPDAAFWPDAVRWMESFATK